MFAKVIHNIIERHTRNTRNSTDIGQGTAQIYTRNSTDIYKEQHRYSLVVLEYVPGDSYQQEADFKNFESFF